MNPRFFPRIMLVTCGVFAVLSYAIVHAQVVLPSQSAWAWVENTPAIDKWDSYSGKAAVTVNGSTFTAKLFDADSPNFVRFTLSGTINGNQIRVRAVREASDIGPSNLTGKVVTQRFRGFADISGSQTIVLSDGLEQVGLTRSLRP